MEDKKLDTINNLLNELVSEAKFAFIKRFSYLKVTETDLVVDELARNAPETDGSILIHIKGYLIVPFGVFKQLLLDTHVAHYNYKIDCMYDNNNIRLILKRFYYHTENKFIFSM